MSSTIIFNQLVPLFMLGSSEKTIKMALVIYNGEFRHKDLSPISSSPTKDHKLPLPNMIRVGKKLNKECVRGTGTMINKYPTFPSIGIVLKHKDTSKQVHTKRKHLLNEQCHKNMDDLPRVGH